MDAQLEVKLIECLDALAQGESIEQILALYPQDAAQLRPLLRTAAGLPALRIEPSEAVKMRSRQKFMAQADMLRRTPSRKSMGFFPRFLTGFVAAGLVAIVLSTGAVAASGSALPGDSLYSVKRAVENVRLSTAGSPVMRDELQLEFDQRRRDEANELLDAGRKSQVEFTGPIESIQPNAWIVDGLVVQVDANTSIVGTPRINRVAEVKGATGPGGLWASSITIESTSESDKTPETEGTSTPEAREGTETPEPTSTRTATTTDAPTRTAAPADSGAPMATSRPTALPRPTATPQPMATAEPVEMEFTGSVRAIDAASWNIDGTTIGVNANTEIRGSINLGQRVKVKALRQGNGQLIAIRFEPIDGGGSGSGSSGGEGDTNHNGNPTPAPNENHNQNGNGNSNDGNGNGDHSGNGNSNSNENHNQNENQNQNENHNSNENSNANSNDHGGNGN